MERRKEQEGNKHMTYKTIINWISLHIRYKA